MRAHLHLIRAEGVGYSQIIRAENTDVCRSCDLCLQAATATVLHGLCCTDIVLPWCGVNENRYQGLLRSMNAWWVESIMAESEAVGPIKPSL